MKRLAAALAALSLVASASAQASPTQTLPRPMLTLDDVHTIAPALEKYAQGTLLGDLWKRPGLAPRDRSIVTLAALIARNQTIELDHYLDLVQRRARSCARRPRQHLAGMPPPIFVREPSD